MLEYNSSIFSIFNFHSQICTHNQLDIVNNKEMYAFVMTRHHPIKQMFSFVFPSLSLTLKKTMLTGAFFFFSFFKFN